MAIVYTLGKCGGLALLSFVGSQQGVEVLRLKVSIFLSTPYYLLPLEVGVAIVSPFKGGFLFMVSLFR